MTEVYEPSGALLMSDLFAGDQQREAVEQAVDGVPRLVDGQDDGATVVRHPGGTGRGRLGRLLRD